ncbi:MAG: DNA polymerase domain-containing protein, partial [Candidatus Methanomethylophilus sp.]|nr:DNA polymerase domain-containing protein [Methanomethylophilus sp.]
MGTWDVRLISASYSSTAEGEPYVELFGKTRERQSIVILAFGFRPYLYAVDPTPALETRLGSNPDVADLEHVKLIYKSLEHNTLKIILHSPWRAPAMRTLLINQGFKVLAGDIQYHDRFIYDRDLAACIRVTGEPAKGYDYATQLTVKMETAENIEPFDPGLKYLSFDIENSIAHQTVYTICTMTEEDGVFCTPDPIYGSEKDIIIRFGRLIETEDPDVITGYNIDNYDIRKLIERAAAIKLKDPLPWGRDRGQPRLFSERFWRVKGRLIVDAWWAAKRELRPKQETLNAVALQVLGEQKLDVDPKHMDDEWQQNREKVIKYCIQDAALALKILLAVGTVRKGMDLAAVTKLPVEDVLVSGTSTLADSLLIRAADRSGIGVPMNGRRSAAGDAIEGGYVHIMKPGLYHWVTVLDFKSMYPSLIIANNICFTTLAPDGEIIAPSGARYMSPERRKGLLPTILSGLMAQRDGIKKQMKATEDPREHAYLNGLQAAVKVVMNTFYGVFASSFYRFTDKAIGASITSFARASITGIIQTLEDEGHPVIYGDTDSVFVLSPSPNLEDSVAFGKAQAERFSQGARTLEFEKLVEPLFSHGKKKRYVGRIVWPEKQDELLVRGYEIRRSDSFDLQTKLLTDLFNLILDEKNDEALAIVKQTVQDTAQGKVDPHLLVISRTCRGLDAYENPERMANVQAAKKLVALGYNFIPGIRYPGSLPTPRAPRSRWNRTSAALPLPPSLTT